MDRAETCVSWHHAKTTAIQRIFWNVELAHLVALSAWGRRWTLRYFGLVIGPVAIGLMVRVERRHDDNSETP